MKINFYKQTVTFVIMLLLTLTLDACGPAEKIGPSRTDYLAIPLPSGQDKDHNLSLKARTASIDFQTTGGQLLEGTFYYNTDNLKPAVVSESHRTSISEPEIPGNFPKTLKTTG